MTASEPRQPPSAEELSAAFDAAPGGYTIGIEEELLLLDPATLEPVPRACEVLTWLDEDRRFKLELPASQLEIITEPHTSVLDAGAALMAARRELVERVDGRVRFAGAGVSPLGSGTGELNTAARYRHTVHEYGPVARRQLVCALQVHVAVPGADRALAVYNHARTYLPWLAALSANGAFYEGRDTGLASVRHKIAELLPRHGIPPALESWERYADALRWGAVSATFPPAAWWWELRAHPQFGTLEFRTPDSQSTVAEAMAIAAVIHALVTWLAARYDDGERLAVADTWRLGENRWSACRHGVEGEMVDPHTGARSKTREGLEQLLEALAGVATPPGTDRSLDDAAAMVRVNGAIRQRQVATAGGAEAVARWLAERFLEPWLG